MLFFRGGTEASTPRRRSRLRENALQVGAGKWPRSRRNRRTWAAAAELSPLTGSRAGKFQATELQAEMRWARVAIDRLRLQLQLSCPPPPALADSRHPSTPRRLPERLATRSALLYVFSRWQTAAVRSAIQIRCGLLDKLDTLFPRPFFDGFPPASFLKTFRAEGNLRLACGLRPATAKTASTLDFLHCAATARSGLQRGCASKILSQFDDSHFCNM